jgi:hypothetical protein
VTNTIYQTTVEELETCLSPRVVSRSLQEGMKVVGKTPTTVSYSDIEKILKAQVYMQLQVTMPVTQAKATIQQILERLKQLKPDTPVPDSQAAAGDLRKLHEAQLLELRDQLRPFNLYFEWPEVQKLRALVQLIETEHSAQREVGKLIADAKVQLQVVEQKLEDQLVQQAKALGDLEASLEVVKVLGGPKVRRLESLIGQVAQAQASRQLAAAEVERARKLVTDLRKLMESSVVVEAPEQTTGVVIDPEQDEALLSIDTDALDPEVSERLLQLDLDSERHDLAQLEAAHRQLLDYRSDIADMMEGYKVQLSAQTSVAAELALLPERLAEAQRAKRDELARELEAMAEVLPTLEGAPEELAQLVQVTRGVLETTLPPMRDISHLRSLFQLAQERSAEQARQRQAEAEAQAARVAQQGVRLERFAAAQARFARQPELAQALAQFTEHVSALRAAQAAGQWRPELIEAAEQLEQQLEASLARQAAALHERQRAQLRSLENEVLRLPELAATEAVRAALSQRLQTAHATLEHAPLEAAALAALQQQVQRLRSQTVLSYAQTLEALVEQAEALGASALKGHLEVAKDRLAEGVFPDLGDYERSLAQALEVRRTEQINDLHLLEEELSKFAGATSDTLRDIQSAITSMRETLARGELVDGLDDVWELLDAAQTELARRSADFVPRLDQALDLFEEVAKLNTDEVAAVRRTLRHLDSQRYVFNRVSAGMRSELEASLLEAEMQLEMLKSQYEATRAVANQLAASNALEGLLGFFDEPSATPKVAAPMASVVQPPEATAVKGKHPALDSLVAGYTQEQGVSGMVIYSRSGEVLSGQFGGAAAPFYEAISDLERHLTLLGNELTYGAKQLLISEMSKHVLIIAWPDAAHIFVIVLDRPSVLSLILHTLRGDLINFAARLSS